jgi:flagellar biosynthesis regulator FlbT
MAHVYLVEFLFDAMSVQDPVRKHVMADDRYEALQLARQLLALQDPLIDADRIDMFKVLRQDIPQAI